MSGLRPGEPGYAKACAAAAPILCAHADLDGRGAHWLGPGETCTLAAVREPRAAARELCGHGGFDTGGVAHWVEAGEACPWTPPQLAPPPRWTPVAAPGSTRESQMEAGQ